MSGKKEKNAAEEAAPAVTELEQLLGAMEERVGRLVGAARASADENARLRAALEETAAFATSSAVTAFISASCSSILITLPFSRYCIRWELMFWSGRQALRSSDPFMPFLAFSSSPSSSPSFLKRQSSWPKVSKRRGTCSMDVEQ